MNRYRLITLGSVNKITGVLSVAFLLSACEPETTPTDTAPVIQSYAFEIIPDDEATQITDIAAKTMELQNKRAVVLAELQQGQKLRGVHPKTHGCVVGELVINEDIPADLQVGLFSKPGQKYETLIRYSNASVRLSPDLENGANSSRGMAVKVFAVDGDMLVNDKGANNQDFLMINTPAFAFPNVRSYQRLTNALVESPSGGDPTAAFTPAEDWTAEDVANIKKTGIAVGKIKSRIVRNPLEVQYFAAAPSAFGDGRVMKFSAAPCGGEKQQAAFEDPSAVTENYLHQALVATMNQEEKVCLDLKVQVVDIDQVKADRVKTDVSGDIIEDATREWDEAEFPFINVATITLPTPQAVDLSDAVQLDCKSQAFNPWHSLAAHQPLGGINRLRKPVYINSAGNRSGQ